MVQRNPHFTQLKSSYLFAELAAAANAVKERDPTARLINLGIGDTSEPLSPAVCQAITESVNAFGTRAGYRGYGPESGIPPLRSAIADTFYQTISPEEIFVSDGAKCDVGRLLMLFQENLRVGIQDPVYPAYRDASLLRGHTIVRLPCRPENAFFPLLEPVDLLFFCSPNNPTGAAATYAQLEELVAYARKHRIIVLYDAAYAPFIQDPTLPRSIYEIPGAEQVAIELCSFSKWAGFTGLRLGWTVVPKALSFEGGASVREDWMRLMSTVFNGASRLIQTGGLAALEHPLITCYQENAQQLAETLPENWRLHGGRHAPYLWVETGEDDVALAKRLLEEHHLIVTPGSGFGEEGRGFIRLSAFAPKEEIAHVAQRLQTLPHHC